VLYPGARYGLTIVNVPFSRHVFIFGGSMGQNKVLDDTWVLNIDVLLNMGPWLSDGIITERTEDLLSSHTKMVQDYSRNYIDMLMHELNTRVQKSEQKEEEFCTRHETLYADFSTRIDKQIDVRYRLSLTSSEVSERNSSSHNCG
jgi:hypothetical protein